MVLRISCQCHEGQASETSKSAGPQSITALTLTAQPSGTWSLNIEGLFATKMVYAPGQRYSILNSLTVIAPSQSCSISNSLTVLALVKMHSGFVAG